MTAPRGPRRDDVGWSARAGRALVAAMLVTGAVTACSADGPATSPGSAKTCEELVQRSAALTRVIVRSLQGMSEADLRSADPQDPYADLLRPYDAFRVRAEQLGCDQVQLRRLACPEYQDIEPTGPAAEEFLSRVPDTCR